MAVISGIVGPMGNVVTQSLRPRMVPARRLGMVTGAGRVLSFGAMPLGALLGGAIGEAFGIPWAFAFITAAQVGSTVLVGATVSQATVDAHELSAPTAAPPPATVP